MHSEFSCESIFHHLELVYFISIYLLILGDRWDLHIMFSSWNTHGLWWWCVFIYSHGLEYCFLGSFTYWNGAGINMTYYYIHAFI